MGMTMKNKKPAFVIIVALFGAVALSGCDTVRKQVGVGRHSPDEFTVVKRAPLTLPPEYALRPPSGDYAPPASEISSQARSALMGEPAAKAGKGAGEDAFLHRAGAAAASDDIRAQIHRDNGFIALENRSVADKLIFWRDTTPDPSSMPASVVNPAKEKERLQKNQEEGKSVNDGNVPVIEKKKGTIDRIF